MKTNEGVKFVGTYYRGLYGGKGRKKTKSRKKQPPAKPWSMTPPSGVDPTLAEVADQYTTHDAGGIKHAVALEEQQILEAAKAGRAAIEAGRPTRVGGRFKRRSTEQRAVRFISSLRMDLISAEALKLHAFMRRVAMSTLISDILNIWLENATDYEQALFKECMPPGVRIAGVPERYVGYHASLGYEPAVRLQDEAAVTAPVPPPYIGPPEFEPIPPAEPPVVPLTFGPVETPARVNVPLPVVGLERPDPPAPAPEPTPAPTGWGNAAQGYMMGMPTDRSSLAALEAERDKRIAELREQSAQTRAEHHQPEMGLGLKPDV